MRKKVRVAIAGVGNCASALVQGTFYYDRLRHHKVDLHTGTSVSNDRLVSNRFIEKVNKVLVQVLVILKEVMKPVTMLVILS